MTLNMGEPVFGQRPHLMRQKARAYFLPPGIWNIKMEMERTMT